eukprot:gene3904-15220_t
MSQAAEQLIEIIEEEEPTRIEVMQDGKKVANVAVTVDGRWQERGHSSKVEVALKGEHEKNEKNMKKKSSAKFKTQERITHEKERTQGKPCETKAGAFGLEVEPEVEKCAKKKQSRKRPHLVTEPMEILNDITFCDEKDIFVTVERKKKR